MKKSIQLISILVVTLAFFTINMAMAQKPAEPWKVPEKYQAMKSTIKVGDASINSIGKELYNKHCKSCHGSKGLGDGPKAAKLETDCGDFSSKAFQDQSDGVIYYQSIVGRKDMPSFEKKILDEGDRWAVIYFLRTLKK